MAIFVYLFEGNARKSSLFKFRQCFLVNKLAKIARAILFDHPMFPDPFPIYCSFDFFTWLSFSFLKLVYEHKDLTLDYSVFWFC